MKRSFDIIVSLSLLITLAPVMAILAAAILLIDGRPVFYVSERMKTQSQPFALFKFRTMREPKVGESNSGVSGGDKTGRITALGRFLRRTRLDEIPQLLNVLLGDMGLVGPRPPLRQYTEQFPDLHRRILRCRPGITGLATLHFHRREEQLIASARTPQETENIYVTRCIPRKARLDLIYARHASVWFDMIILLQTFLKILDRPHASRRSVLR
ncbi:sugar transferase [Octadecabacter sp. G9-8]|uniref:Sugar transferase n=1 Tax=Octadecabacter dasysiphoniae TaxID=2909341 RepID=A0ABS9CVT7_9RHOB|nr:sugar transferase [Octadecabacter dasysiphoniae]MCF2870954.1 sugar transferase [Octadecabacter dasysiphoniae]